jgi:spermidine/putrescine ABC transporter ATP-binding subunit
VNTNDIDLELRGICKKFGSFTAVDNFSISMHKGEFLSFLGPSGCGKTTTLRMIAGFIEPTDGEVFIQGQNVTQLPPYKRDTGMVFQNYALFPHLSVFDNIAFGLRYRKVSKEETKKRVAEMLDLVQLPDVANRKPAELSGGQQQRIALARALVIKPKVLLLDEPLSNLDAKLREGLRIELRDIQQELGITSVFVTHDQEEALTLSDRVVVMDMGIITQIGSPHDIYEKPNSSFEAQFIGQSNILEGTVESVADDHALVKLAGDLELGVAWTNQVQARDKVKVLIRAERIRVRSEPKKEHLREGVNVLKGKIANIAYLGSTIHYYIRLENEETVLAIEQVTDVRAPLKEKDRAFLEINYTGCRFLSS